MWGVRGGMMLVWCLCLGASHAFTTSATRRPLPRASQWSTGSFGRPASSVVATPALRMAPQEADEEALTLQSRAVSALQGLGESVAKYALGAGVAVVVLYVVALQLTHVQLYGVPVVEMAENLADWRILGVPASIFAVSSGYVLFRATRVLLSFVRLLVLVPALGGGVIAASQLQDATAKLNEVPFLKDITGNLVKDVPPPLLLALPELVTFVEGLLLSAFIGGLILLAQRAIGGAITGLISQKKDQGD